MKVSTRARRGRYDGIANILMAFGMAIAITLIFDLVAGPRPGTLATVMAGIALGGAFGRRSSCG
ncbi:MAG: hypothetical protein AB7O32_00065 [Vicinamibacterales bacterium]